jgi:uncharacterized protein (TIGR00255 family)
MKSMTGFGKAVCELPQKKVTIEVRSLNSRQLDLNLRMPSLYREKESELRSEISKTVERGKVDFSLFFEAGTENGQPLINQQLAATYYQELKKLAETVGEKREEYLSLILQMPDLFRQDRQEPDPDEWKQIYETAKKALAAFGSFRDDEGKVLAAEFTQRIGIITKLLADVLAQDPQRMQSVRERLKKHLAEHVGSENMDTNRFEQELIYYLEKLDITEEKLRLQTHCDYFLQTMKEESCGRKLGFITQEIGREINTIGSKANDAGIQKMVVQMKDELEKIKEQLLNVL